MKGGEFFREGQQKIIICILTKWSLCGIGIAVVHGEMADRRPEHSFIEIYIIFENFTIFVSRGRSKVLGGRRAPVSPPRLYGQTNCPMVTHAMQPEYSRADEPQNTNDYPAIDLMSLYAPFSLSHWHCSANRVTSKYGAIALVLVLKISTPYIEEYIVQWYSATCAAMICQSCPHRLQVHDGNEILDLLVTRANEIEGKIRGFVVRKIWEKSFFSFLFYQLHLLEYLISRYAYKQKSTFWYKWILKLIQ